MSKRLRKLVSCVGAFALLSGCGGGGGGGSSPNTPPGGTGNLATITTQNAPTIAGVVTNAALDDGIIGALAAQQIPTAAASSGAALVLSKISGAASPVLFLEAGLETVPCDVSGTVDINVTVADPLMLNPGDEFRLEFTACDNGDGAVTNGAIVMTVASFEGDLTSGQVRIGLTLAVTAFQVTEDGETTSATGTVTFEIDTTMPPLTTITLTVSTLTTTTAGTTETLTNFSVTVSEDDSVFPTAVTVESSGRISSPRIDGDVIVSTRIALRRTGNEEFPFAGELEIVAANDATIVVIALDAGNVRLEIDIDGDGAVDETVDTTWQALTAAADA